MGIATEYLTRLARLHRKADRAFDAVTPKPEDVMRWLLSAVDTGQCYLLDADIIEPLNEIATINGVPAVRKIAPFELRVRFKYDNQL